VFVRDRGMMIPIPVDTIQHCAAADDSVVIHANGRQLRMPISLNELTSRLDPAMFLRVHRCYVVNLDHVVSMRALAGARFALELRDGTTVDVSRKRSPLLRTRGL
jgi:two-component system LytT family response regulator